MRKIAREKERERWQGEWDNEHGRKGEGAHDVGEGECVTTLKKMPATRTKIKMITYPAADVRALRVTHARTRIHARVYTHARTQTRAHTRRRIGEGATRVRRKGQACAGMQDRYRDVL